MSLYLQYDPDIVTKGKKRKKKKIRKIEKRPKPLGKPPIPTAPPPRIEKNR